MSGVVFVPKYDTPGKRDATKAFHPEASRLIERRGGRIAYINNTLSKPAMRAEVEVILRNMAKSACDGCDDHGSHRFGWVAFACHGYASGIQLGYDLTSVASLASLMAEVCEEDVVVPLYCCSTASTTRRLLQLNRGPGGDGGFADELRDALCRAGLTHCSVDAHQTAGHTTKNPTVRRFVGDGSRVGGIGGVELFPRGKAKSTQRRAYAKWGARLAMDDDTLRFDFPWMSPGELHDDIGG